MTRTTTITAIVAGLAASIASAGNTESQTVEFDYSAFDGGFIDFAQFDTQGGTRVLTGLSLRYDQTINVGLTVQSNGPTSISAGDWVMQAGYNSIHQFGLATDGDNEEEEERGGDGGSSIPFNGPGALFQGGITSDLAASDGFNNGGADTYSTTITDTFSLTYNYGQNEDGQSFLDAFTGPGTLNTFIAGFSELFLEYPNDPNWGPADPMNPPPGPWEDPFYFGPPPFFGLFVGFDEIRHFGDITATFEFELVPTPGSASLLGLGALLATRRRR